MELRRRPNAASSSGTVILKSIISAQNITKKDTYYENIRKWGNLFK